MGRGRGRAHRRPGRRHRHPPAPPASPPTRGRVLPAADQRVLTAFGAQVEAALDRDRLTLVTNSLHYRPASDPPVLTASALGDHAELRIIDRGPGIPKPIGRPLKVASEEIPA
jgi:signal transduction histidine kinase